MQHATSTATQAPKRNHMESRQLSEWDQIRIQKSVCKQSTSMILVRSFPLMLKNNVPRKRGSTLRKRRCITRDIHQLRVILERCQSKFPFICFNLSCRRERQSKDTQSLSNSMPKVQVYQFRLNKLSNGRASSNQQNRLQNVWLSSPFAQFVSPCAICGPVTPVLLRIKNHKLLHNKEIY